MSVGNLPTQGDKKNNYPWQQAVLLLLGTISTNTAGGGGIDYEMRITPYKAKVAVGGCYSIGDFISRTDIINAALGTIVSTLWFNETTGLALTGGCIPPIANLDPFIPPSAVTVSNLPMTLGQLLMAQSLSVTIASNQTPVPISNPNLDVLLSSRASEATLALVLAALASIDAGIPAALGQAVMAASMPVVIASNQTAIPVTQSSSARTPGLSRVTSAVGSPIAAGARSVTVGNTGGANGLVLGVAIKPGEVFTWSAGEGDTLTAITYDGSGTELTITTVI